MKLDKSYKTKIDSQEQSKKIQELFFAQGGEWIDGGTGIDSDDLPPREYLFIEVNSKGKFIFGTYEKSYQSFDYTEITAPELIALLSQKETKMTNLADFLKCEKVRCILDHAFLTVRNEYTILSISAKHIEVLDDANEEIKIDIDFFEPVLETAIEASDSLDSTPMGTRTVNEFKVGDVVYYKQDPKLQRITMKNENGHFILREVNPASERDSHTYHTSFGKEVCHATQENYEMLCKLYPHIDFEKPPVVLRGSDLCKAMLDKGWKYVPCYVSNFDDTKAVKFKFTDLITDYDDCAFEGDDNWLYAVPFDPRTGEILTSEVLDD